METTLDCKRLLERELDKLITKNPQYSLRAFARDLGVSPSLLSCVIKGKRRFSLDLGARACRVLKLAKKERDYFMARLQLENARSEEARAVLLDQLNEIAPGAPVHDLSVDHFRFISDWYHIALLELTGVPGCAHTPQALASKLGISRLEAEQAIERLERLGLLGRTPAGKLKKTEDDFLVRSKAPNEALRKYHAQMLAMASVSLETQSPAEKIVGSETLPFSEAQLPAAEKILEECFSRLVALSREITHPESVYHLGIQLFRITKKEKSHA